MKARIGHDTVAEASDIQFAYSNKERKEEGITDP